VIVINSLLRLRTTHEIKRDLLTALRAKMDSASLHEPFI